ncbi:DUF2268 domain-containing protein [Bacillus sp. KH172YL63]|uniref:DUF2268 domain-containing protein n=1 Tax=Bacillus sp. KH172YL63 TaxID=2709784 RepID=UPI0013E426F7|nr:DUF2268 domain-containing putative Zn-dependent protease [Bacillus sp. KH172YL63]BCB03923.1 hypothetical protein KH172YL63_20560 [Bacillus sp. KH172YL63]
MKKIILIILFLLISFLSACSEKEKASPINTKDLPPQEDVTFSAGSQTFHILPYYEEVLDYIEVAEDNSNLNTLGTWNYTVMDPMKKEMRKQKMIMKLDIPPTVTNTLKVGKMKEFTAGLLNRQDETNEIIKAAVLTSTHLLSPGGDKFIYILPVNPQVNMEGMEGVAGWTLDENVILLMLNPSYSNERLAYTMAHEYHHAVTMEHGGGYTNMLDFVLFEGKGDAFARLVYPETETPWTKKISSEKMEMPFSQLRENGAYWDGDMYNQWFMGNDSLNIPKWANYRMGNLIMQEYLNNHKDMTIEEWTSLDADEIYIESEYHK